MARKKPAGSVKPAAIPDPAVPLDWLKKPKVVVSADPPLDWLVAPKVTVGQDEKLAAIPHRPDDEAGVLRPGDALASKREQKTAASELARLAHLPKPREPAPAPTTKIWSGKASDLGERIVDDHRAELAAGKITEHALLKRELPLWRKPNGEFFDADSMRHLLKDRKNKRRGEPRRN